MDDLLKQLGSQGGATGTGEGSGSGPLGGLGDLLAGGGLASILGGAVGGGLGGSVGGGMGGLLGGGLGALLPALLPSLLGMRGGGGGAGASGMHQLVGDMRAQGMGAVADSWVGSGPNEPISPDQVAQALGPEKLAQLSGESGLPPEQVSEGLSAILPDLVNHLTPDGTMPDPDALRERLAGLTGGGQRAG